MSTSQKFRLVLATALVSCLVTVMVSRAYTRFYAIHDFEEPKEKRLESTVLEVPNQASPTFGKTNISPAQTNNDKLPSNLKELTEALRRKIDDAKDVPDLPLTFQSCRERGIVNYKERDCSKNKAMCLRTSIPIDLESRIKELQDLKFLSIDEKYRDVLQEMRSHVKGHYEFIIVSGWSSNHHPEGQGLLKNLHEEMFPNLKVNFTMLIYDIGLRKQERADLEKYCRCTVLSFPFDKFPTHVRNLHCFAWKMLILAAHIEQTEVIYWGDTSIRVKSGHGLDVNKVIETTKIRGVQQQRNGMQNVYHTTPSLFESFGDSPCVHMDFMQIAGGWLFWHREPLIQQLLIEPVLHCALNAKCICPPNQKSLQHCGKLPPKTIGICNRNDQSFFSAMVSRIYREKYHYAAVDLKWYGESRRGHKAKYFEQLAAKEKNGAS